MLNFNMISLPTFSDSRGSLTVLEQTLPFQVVRLFWIYGVHDQVRGGHRHAKTRQALVALKGVVSVYMNDGAAEQTVLLDAPNKCLLVEPKDWHTMTFIDDAILLVASSHIYDSSDYIDAPYE